MKDKDKQRFFNQISRRLDHSPMFISIVIGLLFGAIFIISHWTTSTPIFSWLTLEVEKSMAIVQLLGCTGVLVGILSGTKYLKENTDLRDSYNFVKWSCLPIIISMTVFETGVIFTGKLVAASEVSTLAISVVSGLAWTAIMLHRESNRLTRELNTMVRNLAPGVSSSDVGGFGGVRFSPLSPHPTSTTEINFPGPNYEH